MNYQKNISTLIEEHKDEICSLAWDLRDQSTTSDWNSFYLKFATEILQRYSIES